jgi:NADH-quinone oxidoreductase subunit H
MQGIVKAQFERQVWFAFDNYLFMLVPFVVYIIAATAETNRAPFDLPEAESELVAGFHTEYSGFRWSLYFLAEYANIFVVAGVAVTLFLGGWLRPFPNVEFLAAPLNYGAPLLFFGASGLLSLRLSRKMPYRPHKLGLIGVGLLLLLIAVIFLIPPINAAAIGVFWFLSKVGLIIYMMIWFRGTFPRYRYDQLMDIGWKYMIPIGMGAVLVNALLGMV